MWLDTSWDPTNDGRNWRNVKLWNSGFYPHFFCLSRRHLSGEGEVPRTVFFGDGSNNKRNRVKAKFAIAINIYFVCVQSVLFSSVKTITLKLTYRAFYQLCTNMAASFSPPSWSLK